LGGKKTYGLEKNRRRGPRTPPKRRNPPGTGESHGGTEGGSLFCPKNFTEEKKVVVKPVALSNRKQRQDKILKRIRTRRKSLTGSRMEGAVWI